MIGICLKNIVQKEGFSNRAIDWKVTGHGCFAISSDGWGFSNRLKVVNNQQESFKFNVGDVIFCEYNPMSEKLTLRLNEKDGEF